MRWPRRWALLACMGAAPLALPAAAGAANDGTLRQVGCISAGTFAGCTFMTGPFNDAVEPAFSDNGRFLYVPGRLSNSLLTFERDLATGALTRRSCFSYGLGCTQLSVAPLQRPESIAIRGNSLYVVGSNYLLGISTPQPDGIVQFDLNPTTGLPTYRACYATEAVDGCAPHVGLGGATSLAISPDGRSLYVTGDEGEGGSLAVFERSETTGLLTQAGNPPSTRCIRRTAGEGCAVQPLLNTPRDIEITPDGKQVLIANYGCAATAPDCTNVLAFDRNETTGALTRHPGKGGCVTAAATSDNCQTRPGFTTYSQLALADDGRQIYAIARGEGGSPGLMLIDRDAATGELAARTTWCASVVAACPVNAEALRDGPFDVTLSPDARTIYTTSIGRRIGVFDRAPNGTAAPKPAPHGCLVATVTAACTGGLSPFADTAFNFAIPSPDGRHFYAIGSNRVVSFRVDRAPVCPDVTVNTPHNVGTTVTLRCTDADGDPLTNYRILTPPARGNLGALQGTSVAYGPLVGLSGPDKFTYTATADGIDADPATVTINVGAAPPVQPTPAPGPGPGPACVDADGDGFCASQDCDDSNPSIRPNAREVAGNLIDENCDGVVAPPPELTTPISATWRVQGTRIRLTSLLLRAPLPKGLKVELRCRGKGCPVKRRALSGKASRGRMNVYKSLRGKVNFKAGQVLEVRVTAPDFTGRVMRYTLKRGKVPSGVPLCLPKGSGTPLRSC